MASLSYQEKSLYGELIADVAVIVPYFVYIHTHHPIVPPELGDASFYIKADIKAKPSPDGRGFIHVYRLRDGQYPGTTRTQYRYPELYAGR